MNIYITNFNNLERGFKQLVLWLRILDMEPNVIDNASTYQPLLDYYLEEKIRVHYEPTNRGPYAFWQLGWHKQQTERFIVSDPDVIPPLGCPGDLIVQMDAMMTRHGAVKVGPSLRIDNLPNHYAQAEAVRAWEAQFWERPIEGAYHAQIDTTFALYEPGSEAWPGGSYLRLAPPYQFEHFPWYEDSANPSEELKFYRSTIRPDYTHWSRQ